MGYFMKGSIFSKSVLSKLGIELDKKIMNEVKGNPQLKKEINKVLQKANRRIQNVTNAGLASPAVKAVIAERGKRDYTYFSINGFNPKSETDWEMIKYEYGRAIAFLNNPTSTATGARQYINYQRKELNNIPFESANKIVDLATSPTIDEYGNVNIFSYGALLDRYKTDVMREYDGMKISAEEFAMELEKNLQEQVHGIASTLTNALDMFI